MMNGILEVSGKDKITSRARRLLSQSLLPQRTALVEALDYKLFVHDSAWGREMRGVFTIILTANGSNIGYFTKSIESVLKQSSRDLELILVDHGCDIQLRDLIHEYFLADSRIKLVRFEENIYDSKVRSLMEDRVFNVINSALFCSEGEYVYFLSYDDFLSENYIASMRPLFLENPNCVAVSPAVASVNELSQVNVERTKYLNDNNLRKTYMDGIALATSVVDGGNLFAAPGGLFAYRTDLVLTGGGLDCMNDLSQVFKFAVLGDVGTSQEAVLYWRHHDSQTNKKNARLGALYYRVHIEWLNHLKEYYLQNNISTAYQKLFFEYMRKKLKNDSILNIQASIKAGVKGSMGMLSSIIDEAPKVYLAYFLVNFFKFIPYVIYASLPERVKNSYRVLRDRLSDLSAFEWTANRRR